MASYVIRKAWFSWPTNRANVVLPNVVGMPETQAVAVIDSAQQLGARTTAYSAGVINKGRIISTNPAAGDTAQADSKTVAYVVSDGFACAFTTGTNLVTVASGHGIVNNDLIYFPAIVTTTGISINTLYYAVNVTATTFQVALTPGGAPIALGASGTGDVVRGLIGGPYA